jgi:hypothetical protein
VQRYVADRRHTGASDAIINCELAIVRRGFTLAMQHDPPLLARIPYIPKLEEDNTRTRPVHRLTPQTASSSEMPACRGLPRGLQDRRAAETSLGPSGYRGQGDPSDEGADEGKEARTLPVYGDMLEWLRFQKDNHDVNWSACPLVFHYLGRSIGSHLSRSVLI